MLNLNPFFTPQIADQTEIDMYSDLIAESIEIAGILCYYLPKDVIEINDFLSEITNNAFNSYHQIPIYPESFVDADGANDIYDKFGLRFNDDYEFILSRQHFNSLGLDKDMPEEGDLIYIPLNTTMYQIKSVPHRHKFAKLGRQLVWKLITKSYTIGTDVMNTGYAPLDTDYNAELALNFTLDVEESTTAAIKGEELKNPTNNPFGEF